MHAVARKGPFLGLLLLLLAPFSQSWAVTAGVGETAPQFSLPSLRAETPSITLADHRGKVLYLDFWSAWCAPCRRAMPDLDAVRRDFSRSDFEVIGINVDGEADDGRRVLDELGIGYPVAEDVDLRAAARYGVETLPVSFIIDRNGVVRRVLRGKAAESVDEQRELLRRLVEEQGIR